ncbi:MAG: carboxypeptidase regulatory-like domain-containing protein [Bacteroidetes bacterium]|nr:carboxypeptidase regulatory-like domain-containing protein [Bacteroidota bacterium]
MKTKSLFFNLLIGTLILTSCDKEVVVEPATPIANTNENNIPNGTTTVNYAVQVIAVGETGKTSGLMGATVKIQHNGSVSTATVDASGIAVFSNVYPGIISGFVSASGYTSINFSAQVLELNTNTDANHTSYGTSTIYVYKKNSGAEGRVYADYNLDGNTTISQAANFQQVKMWMSYSLSGYPMGSGNGMLTNVTLDTAAYTVNSNVAGNFTFSSIPCMGTGLTAKYWMEDVVKQNTSGANVIINFNAASIVLNPNATTQVGDIFAQ